MSGFTQSSRVWWNTNAPGAGTGQLYDADQPTTPPSDDHCSGIVGVSAPNGSETCERSGFEFPTEQMTNDPNTGRRVAVRFVDPLAPVSVTNPNTPTPTQIPPNPPINRST